MSKLIQLNLSALAEMDGGRLAEAINQEIKRAALDCEDRPGDDRSRKLTFQIEFSPVQDQSGACDRIKALAQIKLSLPTRKSRVYDLSLRKQGVLVFNDDSLDDSSQKTLGFDS